MRSPLLGAALLTLCVASASGEPSYRMPVYPEKAPPAARTQAEVETLLAGSDATAPAKPLKVLLVAGPKDHSTGEHDYPAWQKVWKPLLERTPQTTVEDAWELPTEEQAADADVMVFYQRGRWDDDRSFVIDPFLARGGGLVYIHWAVDGRGGEAEFAKRIGLASKGGSISYRHGLLHMDFSPGADHPIARNLDKVDFVDEAYWRLTGDPSKLDLIGTSEEEGEPRPLFWTVERGRGRVFVSIPGHYMWTFDDPVFRALLLRGIAWAGRADVDRFNELVTLDARVE
ncbi:Trehalose utilization [Posidoniimonas polymericola]|uniref:Trehalose utilization n=1 Tax=Posidoniimonas polymericola TaxID=2528002 RepID=A0A5C5YRL7_9BACT|nr:ThuA domain-containing protein [Posidoniimonas polymericola]TWT77370.1 Trehalose utilization [Posidoniimonas polymericola]